MQNQRGRRRESGFTLLEVLIAIVIFSIGLLGIAGLQVKGMRFTQGSQFRAVATAQAEDMADRMRANSAGMGAGLYNIQGTMPTTSAVDCSNVTCTAAELATYDLVTWNVLTTDATKPKASNADTLPGGTGVVCIDSTPNDGDAAAWACDNIGNVYAIKISWNERTADKDDQIPAGDAFTSANASDTSNSTLKKRLVMRVIPYANVP